MSQKWRVPGTPACCRGNSGDNCFEEDEVLSSNGSRNDGCGAYPPVAEGRGVRKTYYVRPNWAQTTAGLETEIVNPIGVDHGVSVITSAGDSLQSPSTPVQNGSDPSYDEFARLAKRCGESGGTTPLGGSNSTGGTTGVNPRGVGAGGSTPTSNPTLGGRTGRPSEPGGKPTPSTPPPPHPSGLPPGRPYGTGGGPGTPGYQSEMAETSHTVLAKSYIKFISDLTLKEVEEFSPQIYPRSVYSAYWRWNLLILNINSVGRDPTPRDSADDGGYRLFSTRTIKIQCIGSKVINAGISKSGSKMGNEPSDSSMSFPPHPRAAGARVLEVLEGPLVPRSFGFSKESLITSGSLIFHSWRFGGEPAQSGNEYANSVARRRSTVIWHQPAIVWQCRDSKAILCSWSFRGSAFPTHMLWHDNVLLDTIEQASVSRLWVSDDADPRYVMSGPRHEGSG